MRRLWRQFQALLTPGVRGLLLLWTGVSLAVMVGRLSGIFDLSDRLSLDGWRFWSGQVWRLFSWPLLPGTMMGFLGSALMLVLLGGLLERVWSRSEFWMNCAVAAFGAGLAQIIFRSLAPPALAGMAPVVFGLMVAWAMLLGHERISVVLFGEITVRRLAVVMAAVSLVMTWFSAGPGAVMILLAAGSAEFGFLWLRTRILMSRGSRTVHSERINRLEL